MAKFKVLEESRFLSEEMQNIKGGLCPTLNYDTCKNLDPHYNIDKFCVIDYCSSFAIPCGMPTMHAGMCPGVGLYD